MKARITVMPKRTVLDPQGEAVKEAIHHLGLDAVKEARVGKFIELRIEGVAEGEARRRLETICHELLSNPVIEEYTLDLDGAAAKPAQRKAPSRPAAKAPAKARKAASKGAGKKSRAAARPAKGKGRRGRR